MNNVIKNRLEWFVEKLSIILQTQYGFWKKLGCSDYLVNMISDMQITMWHNITTVDVSLDTSNVYDKVYIPELLSKIYTYGIPAKLFIIAAIVHW